MKTVNFREAKTNFSRLLAAIEKTGKSTIIRRNGKPMADLVPHQRPDRTKPHPVMGKININYDPVKPLSEDEWPEAAR